MGCLGLFDVDGLLFGTDDGILTALGFSLLWVKLTLFRFLVIDIPSVFLCRFNWLFCWGMLDVDLVDVGCTDL